MYSRPFTSIQGSGSPCPVVRVTEAVVAGGYPCSTPLFLAHTPPIFATTSTRCVSRTSHCAGTKPGVNQAGHNEWSPLAQCIRLLPNPEVELPSLGSCATETNAAHTTVACPCGRKAYGTGTSRRLRGRRATCHNVFFDSRSSSSSITSSFPAVRIPHQDLGSARVPLTRMAASLEAVPVGRRDIGGGSRCRWALIVLVV
ncbi:hypothetical protein LXA43DRAFT_298594 [Ganoderma leucocontextum]|nr:hypothetical protein LXA43DRAFT_298594 [Ganoderma leucocontextum]